MKTIKFELQCSNPEGINQYSGNIGNDAVEHTGAYHSMTSVGEKGVTHFIQHDDRENAAKDFHTHLVEKGYAANIKQVKGWREDEHGQMHQDSIDHMVSVGNNHVVFNPNTTNKSMKIGKSYNAGNASGAAGLQASQVPASEHLCQCAKCSCNFDKSKAKQSDAGCSCPNCGELLDKKGAAKVEDQAAKEIKADGDVDAKNATRQPALEAGGPGSGPHPSGRDEKAAGPFDRSHAAYLASAKAAITNKEDDHIEAGKLHFASKIEHEKVADEKRKSGDESSASEHDRIAVAHNTELDRHIGFAARAKANPNWAQASNAKPAASLQAGFNGNQHKSAKELAAEHSVAADTASKVAASASKAARNQDPSNKEGLHGSAITMHTAAKSLHELAAAKHRSAGEEDCAKDHDDAAAGHGAEIEAHRGVIEACGGMTARGNGAAGLEASNPEGINQWSKSGRAYALTVKANQSGKSADHDEAAAAHGEAEEEASKMAKETNGNKWFENAARQHGLLKADHLEKSKSLKPYESRDATPAAGLQLDCSACVEAKNFKSVLNPIADGILMFMPAGNHEITPSQNGRPVTVCVAIDASAADKLETQRAALEAGGKKPFFSVQHSTQIAAFWPAEFFWDTRLDATGSLVEGVWARGEWTRAGREAVEGKDFRTFSPTFFVDAIRNDPNRPVQVVCNDEAKANMGALENDPAFQTISPLWAHDASAAGTPKPKPEGVTTEKLIVMVHDELRASNPDLQDVVNAMSFKYDMRVKANDVARALRGEALEAGAPMGNQNAAGPHNGGGPGSGPHKGAQDHMHDAEEEHKKYSETAKAAGEKARASDDVDDHRKALTAFSDARSSARDLAEKSHAAGYSDRGHDAEKSAEEHKAQMNFHANAVYQKTK